MSQIQGELHQASTGSGQGLIIDEKTGVTVAVVYDEVNTPIIVKAVNLHEELLGVLRLCIINSDDQQKVIEVAKAAIAKAESN